MSDAYLLSEKLYKQLEFRHAKYCTAGQLDEFEVLKEIVRRPYGRRSIGDILNHIRDLNRIRTEAEKILKSRLEQRGSELEEYREALKKHEEQLAYNAMTDLLEGRDVDGIVESMKKDGKKKELEERVKSLKAPERVTRDDVEDVLSKYKKKGYIDMEKEGKIKITSKGADILAKGVLREIIEHFRKSEIGTHTTKERGPSSKVSMLTRAYEIGDDYELLAIEESLLNALERSKEMKIELKDFRIYETVHQSRLCAGLLIDKSGSMGSEGKMNAAIETSLALAELIKRNPTDSLCVFLFSDDVRQIQPCEIINIECGGWTDIQAAMRAFRKAVASEEGDKHAYLVTDTEPNYEDGESVGFRKATEGVMEEALRYRETGITLNIIMLSWTPHLREFASSLARKNLGRVFFTTPQTLGRVIIEDYLMHGKWK